MTRNFTRRTFLQTAGTVAAVSAGTGALAAEADSKPIKILGICCSPRKGKTTATALKICLQAAEGVSDDVEVELIELAGLAIPGEVAAGIELPQGHPDDFPAVAEKIRDPKVAGLIIGTPVYFGNMTSLCKAFLDRCQVFRGDFVLSDKVGGVVAVAGGRNGGQELTIRSVHNCLLGQAMIIVGDGPPSGHWGGTVWSGHPGGVTSDEYGLGTARNLGRRVADIALRLRG